MRLARKSQTCRRGPNTAGGTGREARPSLGVPPTGATDASGRRASSEAAGCYWQLPQITVAPVRGFALRRRHDQTRRRTPTQNIRFATQGLARACPSNRLVQTDPIAIVRFEVAECVD
jgi:hypothetical protein